MKSIISEPSSNSFLDKLFLRIPGLKYGAFITWFTWDTSWDENDIAALDGGLNIITDEWGDGGLGVNVREIGTDTGSDWVDIVAWNTSNVLIALNTR